MDSTDSLNEIYQLYAERDVKALALVWQFKFCTHKCNNNFRFFVINYDGINLVLTFHLVLVAL